jgi:hypothetical protein
VMIGDHRDGVGGADLWCRVECAGHQPGCTPSEEVARSQVILSTTVWIEAARLRIADAADKAEVYRQRG